MEALKERNSWLITIAEFGAWLIASLGTIADALYIRDFVDTILTVLQANHNLNFSRSGGIGVDLTFSYAMTTFDEALIFILGLAAIAAVIWIEYFFRKGRPKGLMFKRIGIVFGVELVIIAVVIILRAIV